jgi:hypothetical protein
MSKKAKKLIKELYDGEVCANECTGLLQKIQPDEEQLKKFHEQFNKDK